MSITDTVYQWHSNANLLEEGCEKILMLFWSYTRHLIILNTVQGKPKYNVSIIYLNLLITLETIHEEGGKWD